MRCGGKKAYHKRQKRKLQIFYILSGIATVCLFFGIVILVIWPSILSNILSSQFVLKRDSKIFGLWQQNPFPLKLDFYLFNWTNPEDFYNLTVKPKFTQLGPYRFTETRKKVKITFHHGNNTVTFKQMRTWEFDETFANKSALRDLVTTINPVTLSASHTTRFWGETMQGGLSVAIDSFSPSVSVTKTVGEVLFDGYPDPLIDLGRTLNLEALPPFDKFGWFYMRNNSIDYDGVFNMGVGANNDLGVLYYWNHWNQTPYYQGECGNVKGSAGELYTGNRTKDPITFFSPDMCKTVPLDYEDEIEVHNVLGYKYAAGVSFLDNGRLLPENKCQCLGDCLPSGAINISTCRYGSPGFVSLPHFYKADPSYRRNIEGMNPSKDKHEFYITLEPQTGIPLDVAARLQINLLVQPSEYIRIFNKAPKVMFPMLWFEQRVQMPSTLALQLRLLINFPIIFTTAGIVLIFVSIFIFSCICYKICTCKLCERVETVHPKEQVPLNKEKRLPINT